MNASKEAASEAMRSLVRLGGVEVVDTHKTDFAFLSSFIAACERKLPSEEAYRRAGLRRKALLKKVS